MMTFAGMGTVVNVAAIIAGSSIGLLIGRRLPDRIQTLLIKAMALATIGIGIKSFLKTEAIVIVLLSLLVGGIVGELCNIEKRLEDFGTRLKLIVKTGSPTFLDGFVTTSLIYCVGPMAVLGPISDGIGTGNEILYAKSVLDGTVSISFAASLGIGVLFSFIPVAIYQGAITVAALLIGNFFTPLMISELTATGGLLIMGIGINLLCLTGDRKIPLGNLLPALPVAALMAFAYGYMR